MDQPLPTDTAPGPRTQSKIQNLKSKIDNTQQKLVTAILECVREAPLSLNTPVAHCA